MIEGQRGAVGAVKKSGIRVSLGLRCGEAYPSLMALASPPRVLVTFQAKRSTVDRACEPGVDGQAVCEQALGGAVSRRWREANNELMEARNAWIEGHGLPLERYRLF